MTKAWFAVALVTIVSAAGADDSTSQLTDKAYLYEVVRHLYRWHLDEDDVVEGIHDNEFVFWVRQLRPSLDPDDHSLFGEILVPVIDIKVTVKKADYTIHELGVEVRSEGFKIINVARIDIPEAPVPAGFTEIRTSYEAMRDHLFRTRNELRPPDDELLEQMRDALRHELEQAAQFADGERPEGEQVVHLAELSPVANEAWVFWETGRLLIRFTSDIDLAHPAMWEHRELTVRIYDIDEQVVVSLDEVAGSNAYLTRDQVGRVLFNCVVLGKRLVVHPEES